ncbi:MAG: response regulator transcription factor, partial [Lachnospiraceae bacterium]|nr:response regulator transcription factor [Lachnospiraceae bacterium]
IRMKGMNGTDALAELVKEYPDAKVLFLTTFVDDEYIVKALELGAKGYIVKQNYENIIPALKAVHSGQNVYGTEVMEKIPDLMKNGDSFDYSAYEISEKEYEIITLVADGLSNKEIASNLYLSEGTVRNYLSSILEKLELRDRTQLAVFYYQHK